MKSIPSSKWYVLVSALVLWIFVVYASFYLVQKPLTTTNFLALVDVVLNLAAAIFIVLLGLASGRRLFSLLRFNGSSAAEEMLLAAGIGLGGLSLATLALGLLGLLHPSLFYLLSIPLALTLYPQFRAILTALIKKGRSISLSSLPRPLALYLAITGLLSLLSALAPPTSWDALLYHLTGPKLYIQEHRIIPIFDAPHFHFPSLVEMLFTYGMLLKGDVAAKLVHFAYGLLTLALVYLFAKRHLAPEAAWLAVAIAASMPMLPLLSSWAYNDVALAFYELAAFYSLLNWFKAKGKGWLTLSATLCGLAMGVKYTSFTAPLALLALILHRARRKASVSVCQRSPEDKPATESSASSTVLLFCAVSGLVASPWYLKNLFFTGNPFYPFLFGGPHWDSFRDAWYQRAGTGIGLNLVEILTLPWATTLGYRDVNFYDGRIGPVLLALLPVVIFGLLSPRLLAENPDQRRTANYLLFFAALHFAFWALGVIHSASLWQSRLLLPGLLVLSIVTAHSVNGLKSLTRPRFSLKRFALLVVAVALSLNLVSQGLDFLAMNPLPHLAGWETEEQYLTRALGDHHGVLSYVNQNLPLSAKVLFLWEPRSYYSQREAWPDAILDNFNHLLHREGDVEGIAARLGQMGVTHVLIYQWGVDFTLKNQPDLMGPAEAECLREFENKHLRLIHNENDRYLLYEVDYSRLAEGSD